MRRDTARFIGPRSVRGLADLLALLGLAAAVAAVVFPLNQLTQPGGQVAVGAVGDLAPRIPDLPAGTHVQLGPDAPLRLVAADLPAWLRAFTEAGLSLTLVTAAATALLLWRLLRSVAQGDVFKPENPPLVAVLAFVVAIGGVLAQAADYWATVAVREHLGLAGPQSPLSTTFTLPLAPIIVGALLLVVAEALRSGARMQADLDGLV